MQEESQKSKGEVPLGLTPPAKLEGGIHTWKDTPRLLVEYRFWRTILMVILGSGVAAYTIHTILIPEQIFTGGIAGVAQIIFFLIGERVSLATIYLALNIPIFILALWGMSKRFLIVSIFGNSIFTAWLFVLESVPTIELENKLIACVFAGAIQGFFIGVYLRYGGSVGGLDIIATYIKKKFAVPMGNSFMLVNACILMTATLQYDINTAVYSIIFMYTLGYTVEKTQAGFSQRKSVYIISSKPQVVAQEVLKELERGYTLLNAQGGYSGEPVQVIYTVINKLEVGRLKEKLVHIDPKAFLVVNTATEVIGNKFLTWADDGHELAEGKKQARAPN